MSADVTSHPPCRPTQAYSAAVASMRTANVYKTVPGQPPLRAAAACPAEIAARTASGLRTSDIQADIMVGMTKQHQRFFFFNISDAAKFKAKLATDVKPHIASVDQVKDPRTQPLVILNIALSAKGLAALNVHGNIPKSSDGVFNAGQAADVGNLGDPGTTNWVPQFRGAEIHGVFVIVSDSPVLIDMEVIRLRLDLLEAMTEVYQLECSIRPGAEANHEHFGWLDGIGQPAVIGFDTPLPGQQAVPPGIILVGGQGDTSGNPAWMNNGSFLVFRQLKQLVPEFHQFLFNQAALFPYPGKNQKQAASLLGARMFGRWQSGAPVELAPIDDNPQLAADPSQNNNFTYSDPPDQTRCPFAAHIRKSRPRSDLANLSPPVDPTIHNIFRASIPYGPELSAEETSANKTLIERGLAFVAYQSSITNGFQFLQKHWSNNQSFIPNKTPIPGFDPITGANQGAARSTSGMNINNPAEELQLPTDFIVSRGGEYFFSPPISALDGILSQ